MSTTWTSSFRLGAGRTTLGRSPFAQGFGLLLGAAMLVVVIPIVAAVVLIGLLAVVALRVRGWIFRQKQPNGMLDGRRNVRVRLPDNEANTAI